MNKIGRNQLCPCGSGKKYKKCCYRAKSPSAAQEEIVRIGPAWVKQNVTHLLKLAMTQGPLKVGDHEEPQFTDLLACHNALTQLDSERVSSDARSLREMEEVEVQELGGEAEVDVNIATLGDAQMMSDVGDALEDAQVSTVLREVNLPTSNRRDRRLQTQLKLSLSQSVLEPFEVIEVLRGSGLKIRSVLNGRTLQINQPDDAARLEPMEWIYGRVVIFEKRAYLLDGWEKIGFRRRKALRASLRELLSIGNEAVPLSLLRDHATEILKRCRLHQAPPINETPESVVPNKSTSEISLGEEAGF